MWSWTIGVVSVSIAVTFRIICCYIAHFLNNVALCIFYIWDQLSDAIEGDVYATWKGLNGQAYSFCYADHLEREKSNLRMSKEIGFQTKSRFLYSLLEYCTSIGGVPCNSIADFMIF